MRTISADTLRSSFVVRRNADKGHPTLIWLEELVEVAEASASAPVYALLKRRGRTPCDDAGLRQPRLRRGHGSGNVALRLRKDDRVTWFRVHAVLNQESIHNHDAFAKIENGGAPR